MARQYIANASFNANNQQFTFHTVGLNIYMKLGDLDRADQELVEMLFVGAYIGFFQTDTEIAYIRVTAVWNETNGLRVSGTPTLTLNASYDIRFSQARPGYPGSKWTGGTAFPTDAVANDQHYFTANVTSGLTYRDTNGILVLTSAKKGDIVEYNGTNWVKKTNIAGDKGWSPRFAATADGATREVLKLAGWLGGDGFLPGNIGKFVGRDGLVTALSDGVNIKGPQGPAGSGGFTTGSWTPYLHTVIWQHIRADGAPGNWGHSLHPNQADNIHASSIGGRWFRWDNEVLATICFIPQISSSLGVPGNDNDRFNNRALKIEYYWGRAATGFGPEPYSGTLPQGNHAVGNSAHGVGMPLVATRKWFGVWPHVGEWRSSLNAQNERQYDTTGGIEFYNSIRVDLEAPPGHNGDMRQLVSAFLFYTIAG